MSADLLRPSPRPTPRPARARAASSAPLSGRPPSVASDSSSSSSAGSVGSYRNRDLLKPYHDFAMQIFNSGHAQNVENLFLAAACDGDYERVENFLRRRSSEIVNIDVKDKRTGDTPILLAAKNGHLKIVQLLLKYGVDITIRNHDNETAIEVAKPGILTALLQSVERTGCSPRHLLQAAWQGNLDVVQRLLNESKILDINCRNADGYTPLLLVTRDVDLFEQIGAALENYSPQAVVRELLLHRADLTSQDAQGRTPLHFAAASKAKVSEEIALVLMSDPAVLEARDWRSLAPLHSASQSGQVAILVALLDCGADVNARGYAGATPLHVSACSGQLQAATKLLNHGADVTLVDDSGNTPVDVAKTKKIKHTLREAWTEATQAKRDLVLTPVKPPSRKAEHQELGVEDRMTTESIGSTPRPGSSLNTTPEKRIVHKMTEAHKAMLAEEQMLRDIESGRFTPSSSPRKLGLPRATSRNGTSPGRLPAPPKTPRVLDHKTNSSSPAASPEKIKKTARSLFGCRSRTNTVLSGESTTELRNQRTRAHAKLCQRNSDPVVSKVSTDNPQVPVTVVGLDLDENLRDIRFHRLVSGPIAPFLERRRQDRVDVSVNPIPPTERRLSAGRRGSNPSVHDLTGACMNYIQKGIKYPKSVGSSGSTISLEDEFSLKSSTPPPKRISLRSSMPLHHLNLEQMHLRLGTPSPIQLFNPTSRSVVPLSPSHFSENVQATIFEFDDEDAEPEDGRLQTSHGNSPNANRKGERKSYCERLTLTRTKSILNHSKAFSIEDTRVVDLNKEVSTDSGQGSRTTDSVSSSSASTLSTPSPLLPRPEGEPPIRCLVTNRLGVNMTPSATRVKDSSVKARTTNVVTRPPSTTEKIATRKKLDTGVTTEISLHSAKTLVVENTGSAPAKKQQPTTKLETNNPAKNITKSSSACLGSSARKAGPNSSASSNASAHGKLSNTGEVDTGREFQNVATTIINSDSFVKSERTSCKTHLSNQTTISLSADTSKSAPIVNGKKHETVAGSQYEKVVQPVTLNRAKHETAVTNQSENLRKGAEKPVARQVEVDNANIKGSNSTKLNSNTKLVSTSGSSHSSSRKASTVEQTVHKTAVNKPDRVKSSSHDGASSAVSQYKSAETKLLLEKLGDQGSSKKNANAKSKQKASSVKLSDSVRKSVGTSQEGNVGTSKPATQQDNKQGKSQSLQKSSASRAEVTPSKTQSLSVSGDMPKVSPRPGYGQGSKSPAGSTEKASPRIQTSKGEPSLSKSFGSSSSQLKTELRNVVQGLRDAKQSKTKQMTNTGQLLSSDEGVGLDLEEQTDKTCTSDEKQVLPTQRARLDPQQGKSNKSNDDQSGIPGKMNTDPELIKNVSNDQTSMVQQNKKNCEEPSQPKSTRSKSDSLESIEEVYQEVVFVSDEERGEQKVGVTEAAPPEETVKIHIKEVDVLKQAKMSKQRKVVRKAGGRIIPAVKTQPKKDQKDLESRLGGVAKSAIKAVGKSVSEATLICQELTRPRKGIQTPPVHKSEGKEAAWNTNKSLSPISPKLPNPAATKFHWNKFKSPEVSPRSDSSQDIHRDPRIIKKHTPVICDVMEFMQIMQPQSGPTPISWKPREKLSSTSSCPNPVKSSTLEKPRRRIASTKEPPRRPSKGSLRKIAITGQNRQKGKAGRPGSGGKSRQKAKKKQEPDAVSTQKKGKLRPLIKLKSKIKPDNLHLLSEADSATKAFITGQGWHIQTEKNETSDIIVHNRSALDSSCDSSSEDDPLSGTEGSPKLSPHNTLMLNELCKIHSISPATMSNIANIMSPLEVDTPLFIPDTMGTIKEFGDSLKSNSSVEIDQHSRGSSSKKFTFEKENVEKLAIEGSSHPEEPHNIKENIKPGSDLPPANQLSFNLKPLSELAASEKEGEGHPGVVEDGGSQSDTPRIITSGTSNKLAEGGTNDIDGEDVTSYETNPDFLRLFRLQDSTSPRSMMLRTELAREISKMENAQDWSLLPEPSAEENGEHDRTSAGKVSHKPPLPSKINSNISELTRVPRGSIRRRHSEPPAKVPENQKDAAGKWENVKNVVRVKNSWEKESEIGNPVATFLEVQGFEDHGSKLRSNWRERSQVEDMVSPLKSRLPDKNFSPPSSSQESPTRRRGNSMPEVINLRHRQEQHKNRKRSLEEASNGDQSSDLPARRKPSNYSEGSEVFLNDITEDDHDDDEDAAFVHEKEQLLTEHVQHMSINAIQELSTVLSQAGDIHFDFPSPTLRPQSREGDAESIGFGAEASDWLNRSLAVSEASDILTRTFSAMSSELQNTQSSGLSSERSHSSSTNLSESEGGLLHWKKGNILGRGAFGVVYCGLTNTGQLIAVKQVELKDKDNKHKSRQQYEKLQEEVELLKTLRHRNIVGFLGVSLEGNTVNIFMQYIPGGSIASLLARFGALEEPVFCRYTKQILQGTEYLHAKNVIHRDIKGANIMLMSNGVIKLIDFGCAKRLCINISQSQNLLKSMRGTPYWMAPEVIMETGHGKKSDIWSIGCTVFEMATRKPPWSEMPPMSAIFAIGSGGLIPQLPERFSCFAREFVNACLTREQNERPTATQLLTHSFIRKRRERGRDRFETRISSSTMEDANITFKEQVGSEDNRHETEKRTRKQEHFS